ncbi:MAG: pseudouridine-5'-phosphate glycosidase, partial [Actinomycetota bacterium]|nr:pseudouridine-5'-phosphate glycosidase [Actinomycetota bacterium]
DRDMIATAIESGLAAAATRGIRGREVTPFLLTHVAAATDGRSVEANMALVRDNAAVAGRIAVALAALRVSPDSGHGGAG